MHPSPEQNNAALVAARGKSAALLGKYRSIMRPGEVGLCTAQPDRTSATLWLNKLVALEGILASRATTPLGKAKGF